ncbi:hypothetical protein [Saccharopolyspora tripterygii]
MFDPATSSTELIDGFRRHFTGFGHVERRRRALVSRHDPSIRFTNSTISVLKADLLDGCTEDLMLVQPALRLRNLAHWRRTGEVSGFGCYFVALGTLSPPGSLHRIHKSVLTWFTETAGVAESRIVARVSSADDDLLAAAADAAGQREIDGCPQHRYRHVFGVEGVRGRNLNLALRTRDGLADICNIICIERDDGTPLAVESAFGVNTVLARVHDLPHVLDASPAAAAAPRPPDLMALDALGSALPLLAEGLRPRARGRSGNLHSLLAVLRERLDAIGWGGRDVTSWVRAAAEADHRVRARTSPATDDVEERSAAETARQVLDALGG